jgi:hypothetical protein
LKYGLVNHAGYKLDKGRDYERVQVKNKFS